MPLWLKTTTTTTKKTFINARKHQFQTLLLKFAEIIKPSNFNFQKPFYRANSTSFQSFRCLVSLSFKSEVNALWVFFFHQDGIFTKLPVLSPHVREHGFRNKRNLNPESWALESRIQLKKSGIPITIGFYWKNIRNPVPATWNPRRGIQIPSLSWIHLHEWVFFVWRLEPGSCLLVLLWHLVQCSLRHGAYTPFLKALPRKRRWVLNSERVDFQGGHKML